MKSPGSKSSSSGFTLIELMVALTILAALMAVTFSGFQVAVTIWEKGNARADALDEQQTTLTILRDQLRGALPLVYSREEQLVRRQRLAFDGQSNRLQFVSRTSWRDGAAGPARWIELRWDNGLVVEERSILPPWNEPGPAPVWRAELPGVEDFQLSYLARSQGGRRAEWMNAWDIAERRELPAAVRVHCKIRGEWTPLLIPLDYVDMNWRGHQFQ